MKVTGVMPSNQAEQHDANKFKHDEGGLSKPWIVSREYGWRKFKEMSCSALVVRVIHILYYLWTKQYIF